MAKMDSKKRDFLGPEATMYPYDLTSKIFFSPLDVMSDLFYYGPMGRPKIRNDGSRLGPLRVQKSVLKFP